MRILPDSVSGPEFVWILGAVCGVIFSIIAILLYDRICRTIREEIRHGRASYTGPRWHYGFGTLVAMVCFLPGWTAFLLTGIIAGVIPEPPDRHVDFWTLNTLFEMLIIGGELSFAAGQGAIVLVWFRVKAATVFVPPVPGDPNPRERVRRV